MTGLKRRLKGRSRDGLFDWQANGDVEAGEITSNPLLVACDPDTGGCGAAIGQRCTRPSRHGRREVAPHPTRRAAANTDRPDQQNQPERPPSAAAEPRTEPRA